MCVLAAALILLPQVSNAQMLITTLPDMPQIMLPISDRTQFQDWDLVCRDACLIAQDRPLDARDAIGLSIERIEDDRLIATLRLPFGLLLLEPVRITVDGRNLIAAPVRTCLPDTCLSAFVMTDAIRRQMQRGQRMNVEVRYIDGRREVAQFSLFGITAALAEL